MTTSCCFRMEMPNREEEESILAHPGKPLGNVVSALGSVIDNANTGMGIAGFEDVGTVTF